MRRFTLRLRVGGLSVPALLITVFFFCGASGARAATAPVNANVNANANAAAVAEKAAETAAANWLALVDAGEYDRSWTQAAGYLRRVTTQSSWSSSVAHARAICGALKSRLLKSVYATSNLPDSPPGHYVVIHYASRFVHNSPATETLTLIEDSKGTWRVVGYYIS